MIDSGFHFFAGIVREGSQLWPQFGRWLLTCSATGDQITSAAKDAVVVDYRPYAHRARIADYRDTPG